MDGELDHLVARLQGHPDVRGARVLERVHHRLAGDVVDEQRDRRGKRELVDVGEEADARPAADVFREALQRLGQAGASERRAVQVTDERTHELVRLILRLADLLEVTLDF